MSNNPSTDRLVGGQVREQRESANKSAEELANHLEITLDELEAFERGDKRIGSVRLARIAAYLNVQVGVFFEESDV